jgi:cytochrome c-type biogenesis protein CcmH
LPGDASAEIQAIEQKLTCHCGCTLDIFTCRTTDFTCTTSPRLHRQVVALYEGGADAQDILDAFVAQYGERALMAPEPKGFNLAGYLLPGALILLVGSILAWVIGRRFRLAGTEGPGPEGGAGIAAGIKAPEQLGAEAREQLRRALAEVED